MNRLLKAGISVGAALFLVLGTGGTIAYWNDTASLSGGAVTAGTLSLTPSGTGSWTDANGPITISTFKASPGDVLTFSQNLTVVAQGNNLEAQLSLTPGSIVAANGSNSADVALAAILAANSAIQVTNVSGPGLTANGSVYDVGIGTSVVTVKVVLTWPNGTTATDNAAKLGSVSLSSLGVSLTQVL